MQDIAPYKLQTFSQASMLDPNATDLDLIQASIQGNSQAFKAIYDRYAPRLYQLAYRFHGNAEDAQDSLQDAFVNVYRSLASFKADSLFTTWLHRITMNACISRGRSNKRHKTADYPPLELVDPTSGRSHKDSRLEDLLNKEILRLKEKYRAVFLLFAVEGFSHAEIASTLGLTENTSKSLYFRAKKTLVRRLEQHGITKEELIR